jgi:lipopolysaccharide biosynthesis glycosyltransferase
LEGIYTDPRYTEAASFRLLLPELLPEYDSIVYIDCDVIVRQDIGKLYREKNLADNYIAAIFEAPIEHQAERFKALGCDPLRYFNSGFLLMNLKQMRAEKVSERLLEACRVPYLEFPDQDALNQVCQGRVLPLSPVFNSIRTFFLPQYKKDFCKSYSEILWDRVQQEGTIHFTGGKPWNVFTVRFGDWWRVYYSLPRNIQVLLRTRAYVKCLSWLYKTRMGKVVDWGIHAYRRVRYK